MRIFKYCRNKLLSVSIWLSKPSLQTIVSVGCICSEHCLSRPQNPPRPEIFYLPEHGNLILPGHQGSKSSEGGGGEGGVREGSKELWLQASTAQQSVLVTRPRLGRLLPVSPVLACFCLSPTPMSGPGLL